MAYYGKNVIVIELWILFHTLLFRFFLGMILHFKIFVSKYIDRGFQLFSIFKCITYLHLFV